MFNVEGTTISLSRGDTGAVRFRADVEIGGEGGTAYTFGENDRAIFTIKNGNGEIVKEKITPMENNVFTVVFYNADTDALSENTSYTWDVRYVINPYWENGRIVDGDQVLTPELPMSMRLLNVVGEI